MALMVHALDTHGVYTRMQRTCQKSLNKSQQNLDVALDVLLKMWTLKPSHEGLMSGV